MSVTEAHMAHGKWSLGLDFPGATWDDLLEFGHILITARSFDPTAKTDAQFLAASLYTGVLTQRTRSDKTWAIGGSGMEFWLGEGQEYGEVLEPPKTINVNYWEGGAFATVLTTLLPAALTVGTINTAGITASYYNEHVWDTPLQAIRYVIDAFAAIEDAEIEYRVNKDGTFDAGLKGNVYDTSPSSFIVRRKPSGTPGTISHGRSRFRMGTDVRGYATRAVIQGQGAGYTLRTGEADLADIGASNPYKDLQGNTLVRVKVISEPESPQYSDNPIYLPDARAELHLKESQELSGRLSLSNTEWHIEDIGSFNVGDTIWVYDDTDNFWEDTGNPQAYDGGTVFPVEKRVFKKTWPIHRGKYKVFYRDKDAAYTELTSLIVDEEPQKMSVEVGTAAPRLAYNPDLLHSVLSNRATHNPDTNNPDGSFDDNGDPTIPNAPTWASTPWGFNTWLDQMGVRKVEILVQWNEPTNTDTSAIIDGDRYVLEYKRSTESTWRPGLIIPWGNTSRLVSGLESTPNAGWTWDFRIHAVDKLGYVGDWSTTESVATVDEDPPSQPAQPTLAPLPIFIQVTHDWTKQGGGALEGDTEALRIHASTSTGFTPSAANLVLSLIDNNEQQVVGYFESTPFGGDGTTIYVKIIAEDRVGNQSVPSTELSVVSVVIDTTEITDNAITTPKLIANSVVASKIASLELEVGKHIRSTVYTPGSAGWTIEADGSAEFSNITVRGEIVATSGSLSGLSVTGTLTLTGSGIIKSGNYSPGSAGWQIEAGGDAEFNNVIIRGEVIASVFKTASSGSRIEIDPLSNIHTIDWYEGATLVGQLRYFPTLDRFSLDSFNNRSLTIHGDSALSLSSQGNVVLRSLDGAVLSEWKYVDSSDQWQAVINDTTELILGGTGFLVPNVYTSDFSGGSTVYANSDGRLHINTSSLARKAKITFPKNLVDIDLLSIRYRRKGDTKAPFEYSFGADWLAEQDELLVTRDSEGKVHDFKDRGVLAVLASKEVRDWAEIQSLRTEVERLQSRMQLVEDRSGQ